MFSVRVWGVKMENEQINLFGNTNELEELKKELEKLRKEIEYHNK